MDNYLISMAKDEELLSIPKDWVLLDNWQLKVYLMLLLNNNEYIGNLSKLSELLDIKPHATNNLLITHALSLLSNDNYIKYSVKGRTYSIAINKEYIESIETFKVYKQWIKTLLNYKELIKKDISISEINLIRVFLYLYCEKNGSIETMNQRGDALWLSKRTVIRASNIINQLHFSNLAITKRIDRRKDDIGHWYCTGTEVQKWMTFDD